MKKVLRATPLIFIYITIIYFSVKSPSGTSISIPYMDKVGHFIAYFVLGFTICLSIQSNLIRGIFIFISLSLGITLEFIQSRLPYRDMSFMDGVTNVIGLFCGVLLFMLFSRQVKWLIKKLKLNKLFN